MGVRGTDEDQRAGNVWLFVIFWHFDALRENPGRRLELARPVKIEVLGPWGADVRQAQIIFFFDFPVGKGHGEVLGGGGVVQWTCVAGGGVGR